MYTLSLDQKISNLEETLKSKKAKRDLLNEEVQKIEAKLEKLKQKQTK